MKRGARPSSSDPRQERSSRAPASSPKLPPLQRGAPPPLRDDMRAASGVRHSAPGLSEEARAYSRDDHEAHLLEQFFSWPPPPPRAADLTFEPFERAPMDRGSRRAMWASSLMLIASALLIGGYIEYHDEVILRPAELGDWSDADTLALPTPILAPDIAQADLEPRRTYQASLQHDHSAATEAEPAPLTEAANPDAPPDPTQPPSAAQPSEPATHQPVAPANAANEAQRVAAATQEPGVVAPANAASEAERVGTVAQAPGSIAPANAASAAERGTAAAQASLTVAPANAANAAERGAASAHANGTIAPANAAASVGAAARAPGSIVPANAAASVGAAAQTPGSIVPANAPERVTAAAQAPGAIVPANAASAGERVAGVAQTPGTIAPANAASAGERVAVVAQAPGSVASANAASAGERVAGVAQTPGSIVPANAGERDAAAARPNGASPSPNAAAAQPPAAVAPVRLAEVAVDFDAELAQARKLLAQGEHREALPVFERALAVRAHSVDALLGKASALFALQDYEAAKGSAQQAIAIDPRSNQGFVLIGQSFERLGRKEAAQNIYERCVEQAVDLTQCRERLNALSGTR